MNQQPSWRLLIDGSADGPWNMAVDEAILDTYAGAHAPSAPTLRLYSWSPPALSLGARQEAACDAEFLRAEQIGLVRRPTGGRAVLHEHERTFSVVGSLRREPFPGGVLDTYRRIAAAIVHGFRRMGLSVDTAPGMPEEAGPGGPPACFDRPSIHEITIGERKIVGSAQMRRRGAFLQHGSILMRGSADRLSRAVGAPVDGSRFTDLEAAMGRAVEATEIDAALAEGFSSRLEARLIPGALTEEERVRAAQLRCWKYDSAEWTLAGRIGSRERAWGPLETGVSAPPL